MASKKTSSPAGKGAAKGAVKKFFQWTWGKIFKRSLLFVLLIALGGFLFNIDRLGNTGVNLLKFKEYLPGFIVRFLPGGTAQEGPQGIWCRGDWEGPVGSLTQRHCHQRLHLRCFPSGNPDSSAGSFRCGHT